ncbi:acyl-CoA thioesterase [Virgibacillus litoralis]|uniref:Acyl-CoA thioester hydrolase n=1 Tax=Virgibacillus litoralis TaxID=578221 RepID=A0ABS4H9X7_9BACI|nr:thioesterase family protein [Virgibacillus litoralis]MBP1947710.1 acyl-CoA thioester hydrolase [Virgibacillus litoralis]
MKTVPYIEDLTKWQSEFSFYIPIKIRFSETDMFGHVNNVSAFIYFEEARIEFLKSVGLFQNVGSNNGGVPIVADLQCDYHKQMYFNEQMWHYVKVNHIGNTSLDIHYMALNDKDELCLTGRGRLVNIHPESGKPMSISTSIKEKLLTKTDFQ